MNSILFIGATHGDEPIGVHALQTLSQKAHGFDWIIGNEKAYDANTREFEGNLNRSAPGMYGASNYAARRAAEIIALSTNYRYTIDIHGTIADTGIFVIVTNPTEENIALATSLGIHNIVIWPASSQKLTGPLTRFVPCGVGIECGPKDSPEIQNELVAILERFLVQKSEIKPVEKKPFTLFEVYGTLQKPEALAQLKEFQEVEIDGERFVPLLIGRYPGVTCYKMRVTNKITV